MSAELNETAKVSPDAGRKVVTGVVVSNAMNKTVVVEVHRKVPHAKYQKFVSSRKKYYVHDEKQECNVGDEVEITETRPLSKLKRWRLTMIKARAEVVKS